MKKVFMIIFIIVVLIFIFLLNFTNSVNMGTSCTIKENNLEITVNKVEEVKITDSFFEEYNGDYIKVNVTVKNNNASIVNLYLGDFSLVDGKSTISVDMFNTNFNYEIAAYSENTGDLFFQGNLNKNSKLRHIAFNISEGGTEQNTYYFKLK